MAKGELLKRWRIGHALSQAALAQSAEIDVRTIRRAESGEPIDRSSTRQIAEQIKKKDNDPRDVESIVREMTDVDSTIELLEARLQTSYPFGGDVRKRGDVL